MSFLLIVIIIFNEFQKKKKKLKINYFSLMFKEFERYLLCIFSKYLHFWMFSKYFHFWKYYMLFLKKHLNEILLFVMKVINIFNEFKKNNILKTSYFNSLFKSFKYLCFGCFQNMSIFGWFQNTSIFLDILYAFLK